ncbi:MAG: cytochrome c [Sulfuritalea sp.]|nr:cytochrome c [Sulfuritalea sp.]
MRCWLSSALNTTPAAAESSPARQKELIHPCAVIAVCHGMTLKGGLGPALLPATLADKPAEGLAATIVRGRPGTPMLPWHRFLAEDEAQWIVAR